MSREVADHPDLRVREYTASEQALDLDLRSASVVLMPSRREGFGLVGLEAIARGIPVLVSAESGLGEYLSDQIPEQRLRRCVLPVSGDLDRDAPTWSREIDFVLGDRKAAFQRASELRELLARDLNWRNTAKALLSAVGDLEA